MSLPPQIIRIKRKKVDEPVDTLYVESDDRSKRRVTHHGTTFTRLKDADETPVPTETYSLQENDRPSPPVTHPRTAYGVPIVKATLPGKEEENEGQARTTAALKDASTSLSPAKSTYRPATPAAPAQSLQNAGSPIPRRFHLSNPSLSYPSVSVSGSSGIQKRKRNPKREIAVFEERRSPAKVRDTRYRLSGAVAQSINQNELVTGTQDGEQVGAGEPPAPRKRPGATAVERAWRAKNWGNTVAGTSAGVKETKGGAKSMQAANEQSEYSSELIDYMEKFALQEAQKQNPPPPQPVPARPATRLKTMPRVPALRYKDRHPAPQPPPAEVSVDADAMDLTPSLASSSASSPSSEPEQEFTDDSEYTYDTYTRDLVPLQIDSTDPAAGKIGLLVITEEEQQFWESYVEQCESENEWDSDVDDENAENYYGADYPEDEVASDDERDVDAYKYRHNGSDDEEFGDEEDDEVAWSDEGEGGTYPWARRLRPWEVNSGSRGRVSGEDEADDDA